VIPLIDLNATNLVRLFLVLNWWCEEMFVKLFNGEEKLKFSPNKYWAITRFRTLVTDDFMYKLYDDE